MPRPKKCRKVCNLPDSDQFGPLNKAQCNKQYVTMTVDEYETIRLIDLHEYTQEECANQMKVARTTIQAIYNDARKKLAQSLVNGNLLRIEGGDILVCDGLDKSCCKGNCIKKSD
ncbi:DUF134 domain-containing protein [Mobilitalea sibirica]|uniref:UPF0251 protein I5677_10890 n=1 Tax=Mobilitalea sibirica TaxID=1462919 RepID=A0A8J7H352_9FIRM|nr:DUF134 domain-containing protein [Mobilitalea sibirica]MBH1941398.1 DUF134 domain-containing protein [Mobilitalea sibirica]